MSEQSLREAMTELRADLDRSYPDRAPYDIPSTVIDRLDAAIAATCGKTGLHGACVFASSHQSICRNSNGLGIS